MKLSKKILFIFAPVLSVVPLAFIACGQEKPKTEIQKPSESKPQVPEVKKEEFQSSGWLGNVWNTLSAEKDAMALTAYNTAKHSYDAMVKQTLIESTNKVSNPASGQKYVNVANPTEGKFIPVVFMDIDETVLNNYAYQNYNIMNKDFFTGDKWHAFVIKKMSKKIAGAIEFIKYVWSKGGVVMFNSNRRQFDELVPTRENLIKEGLDEKYLPDWVFWMQGLDLENAKPWSSSVNTDIAENKSKRTDKEERMHLVSNKTAGFDLSDSGSGNAVKFKVIMRIGDNFDDFNDNASYKKNNKERSEIANNQLKDLWANFDITKKGKYYNKKSKATNKWEDENHSESYIQIGGNTGYGGFETGLDPKWYSLAPDKKKELLEKYFADNLGKYTPDKS